MRGLQGRLTRSGTAARRQVVLTVLIGLAGTALIVAQATLLASVIAGAFIDGEAPSALTGALVALAAVSIGRGLVGFGFEWTGRVGAANVMESLRGRLAEQLLLRRPFDPERRGGALAAAGVQGVEALEAYYAKYLPYAVLAALAPPVILLWILPRDWEAALILGITFPLIPVFMVLVGKLSQRSIDKRWQTLAGLSARFLDLVRGLETLRALGRARDQERAIGAASDGYRVETMATLRVAFLSALVLELLAMIGTAVVAATVGVQLASGSLGFEAGLTVLLLAPEIYMPLRQVGAQYHAANDGLSAAETIFEVLDAEPTVSVPAAPKPAPDPRREPLVLEDVSFRYPGRPEPVLDGLDLRIEPGTVVAITGPSGSGKSTLASLLLRLTETREGELRCGDVALADTDPADWRERVAWVPQRPTIFAGTLAENVALHDPSAPETHVLAALRAAGGLELVGELPGGLDARVGEGGRRLSAGQSQRVALARAFLRNPSFVVLDEPTAHLDEETAASVGEAIAELLKKRTGLLIAHRPRLVEQVSAAIPGTRVLELDGGRLHPGPGFAAGAGEAPRSLEPVL